jgi:hypothetical protein
MSKLILVACEESQEVTIAFRKRGFEAYSCDRQDCSGGHPEWHIKDDAIKVLRGNNWDGVIAHPPCTRMTNAGVRWLTSRKPRAGYVWCDLNKTYVNSDFNGIWADLASGITFFQEFKIYGMEGNAIAIENPKPHKYAREGYFVPGPGTYCDFWFHGIGNPSQYIHPYQFGHTETKETGLWLYNLPCLIETNNVYDEMMKLTYKDRAKVHYASPGPDRAKIRSKTYTGIAEAMAEQWGNYIIRL